MNLNTIFSLLIKIVGQLETNMAINQSIDQLNKETKNNQINNVMINI